MRKTWIAFLVILVALGAVTLAAFGIAQQSGKAESPAASAPQDALADPVFDQRVSVEFKDASFRDVLDWLSSTGVNFVAPSLAREQRVTLKVENVPLRDLLRALSDIFGMTWSKQGEVYALRPRGMSLILPDARFELNPPLWFDEKSLEEWLESLPRANDPRLESELRQRMEELFQWFRDFPPLNLAPKSDQGGGTLENRPSDVERLMDSLTEEQWQKHKSRGYLRPEDLTPEQRRLLRFPPSPFEMHFDIFGRKLTIKG
jgi:hypothetical protein